MKFVDLFSGLGGFHLALRRLGHECVFACELDATLRELYERNFSLRPTEDIRELSPGSIPDHDILCAGFPCQPFSKAGEQFGFDCPRWGDLFGWVARIIKAKEPTYLLLENVPNLRRHANGKTWAEMEDTLRGMDYDIASQVLSPHSFGIPQIRDRVFVVGSKSGLQHFRWPQVEHRSPISVRDILDSKPKDAVSISPQVIRCLNAWQQFLRRFPKSKELPSFPIWSMEFGATYPFVDVSPALLSQRVMHRYCGSHGRALKGLSRDELLLELPSYARGQAPFPSWKVQFIRQNRELYSANKAWIDSWLPTILSFPPSLQKFEWNCKGEERNIWDFVIQFRASGVRVKRPTTAPSLVAMTTTQVPIVAWEKRYMTPRECSRLQSMEDLRFLPARRTAAHKALGNAVNVEIVRRLASALVDSKRGSSRDSASSHRMGKKPGRIYA